MARGKKKRQEPEEEAGKTTADAKPASDLPPVMAAEPSGSGAAAAGAARKAIDRSSDDSEEESSTKVSTNTAKNNLKSQESHSRPTAKQEKVHPERPARGALPPPPSRPRWVELMVEQRNLMDVQQPIGEKAKMVFLWGLAICVYTTVGSVWYICSTIYACLAAPWRAVLSIERVVSQALDYALPTSDGKSTTVLEAHKFDGVVNSHRVVDAKRNKRNRKELKLIFNVNCKESLPPFDVGNEYEYPLFNKHIGTVLPSCRPYVPHRYYREKLKGEDDATLCVDWAFSTLKDPNAKRDPKAPTIAPPSGFLCKGVVGVVPGLASSSHSSYIETMARHLTRNGYHVAVINARGMGTTPLDKPKIMTGVWTSDIRTVVYNVLDPDRLRDDFGIEAPVFLAGTSLGAAKLCKFLGEEKDKLVGRVKAAVAFAAPWDYHESSENMLGFEALTLYQPFLSKGLQDYLLRHQDVVREMPGIDVDLLLSTPSLTKTVQRIDDLVVAPSAGFPSRFDYYTAASPMPQYLQHVKIPLLCVSAEDDPITGKPPVDARWEVLIRHNPNISFVEAPAGGHLGFLMGPMQEWRQEGNFMEKVVVDMFDTFWQRRNDSH